MIFNSLPFAVFFAALFLTYYITPLKFRTYILLIFSVVFYIFSGVENLPFILLALATAYLAARKMGSIYAEMEKIIARDRLTGKEKAALQQTYKRRCKKYLLPALVIILGMLLLSKAGNMAVSAFAAYMREGEGVITVIVPLGISYYTFSLVGYVLDVYWQKMKYVKDWGRLALGVFYFPQILQGPISKYSQLLPQFEQGVRFDFDRICLALQLMLWGYFKKLVIADRLSVFVTGVFGGDNQIAKTPAYVIALALFFGAMQLYADFSACMDIASGISEIFGIALPRNFNQPFMSRSIAEFWRRWHITLGAWFKDYVYLPLATSRWLIHVNSFWRKKTSVRVGQAVSAVIPLAAVWLLTGLWHGTGWNYVLWGTYYGLIIICTTIWAPDIKKLTGFLRINTESYTWGLFQMVRTTALFCIGRLITLPASLSDSVQAFGVLMDLAGWLKKGDIFSYGLDSAGVFLGAAGVFLMLLADKLQAKESVRTILQRQNIIFRWTLFWGAMFIILFCGIYGPGYEQVEFVYMNF